MRVITLTDAELQALIGTALRAKFRRAGFHTYITESETMCIALPVNLRLAGDVEVSRDEDGVWTFKQELDQELSERTDFTAAMHIHSVQARSQS